MAEQRSYRFVIAWIVLSMARYAWGAEATETEKPPPTPAASAPQATEANAEPGPALKWPDPLGVISSNLPDLEKTGHFTITSVKLGRSELFGDESLIWTVRVDKPLTCRHATILLRRFGDVRLLHIKDKVRKDLYWGELYYSTWVAFGAVQGDILDQDDEFNIWLVLDAGQCDMLGRQKVNTAVFGELK
jgi:hypothetical protein